MAQIMNLSLFTITLKMSKYSPKIESLNRSFSKLEWKVSAWIPSKRIAVTLGKDPILLIFFMWTDSLIREDVSGEHWFISLTIN